MIGSRPYLYVEWFNSEGSALCVLGQSPLTIYFYRLRAKKCNTFLMLNVKRRLIVFACVHGKKFKFQYPQMGFFETIVMLIYLLLMTALAKQW